MTQFSREDIMFLKHFLQEANDQTLFELFGSVFETVKQIIRQQKEKEPYQFYNKFGDLN